MFAQPGCGAGPARQRRPRVSPRCRWPSPSDLLILAVELAIELLVSRRRAARADPPGARRSAGAPAGSARHSSCSARWRGHGTRQIGAQVAPHPHEPQRVPEDAGLQRGVGADLDDDARGDPGERHRQPAAAEPAGADPVGPRVVAVRRGEARAELGGLAAATAGWSGRRRRARRPGSGRRRSWLGCSIGPMTPPASTSVVSQDFDLEPLAAAGRVPRAGALGDEPLDAGRDGSRRTSGGPRPGRRWRGRAPSAAPSARRAPRARRRRRESALAAEVGAARGEQVEGDVGRRVRGDQRGDPSGRGHHALLEQAEVEPRAVPDDDLAVEDRAGRHLRERGGGDVGEAVGQVAALLGPDAGRAGAADDDQPVAVPLGLVLAAAGQRVRRGDRGDGLVSSTRPPARRARAAGPADRGRTTARGPARRR